MSVGIIGLGAMGGAYARNLLAGGIAVHGFDPDPSTQEMLTKAGGTHQSVYGDWLCECEMIILSIASTQILADTISKISEILKPGQVVLETGTFTLNTKQEAKKGLDSCGAVLLDCPVSGTGAQAAVADLVMMASGPEGSFSKIKPLLEHFTKAVIYAGPFGNGSKLKFVANHAVYVHNCAAAESLNYGITLGLEPKMIFDLLTNGAGQSKMSDLRMPLMIDHAYEPATANMPIAYKDISVISEDIKSHKCSTPLFDITQSLYDIAKENVPNTYDTGAIYEVYKQKLIK